MCYLTTSGNAAVLIFDRAAFPGAAQLGSFSPFSTQIPIPNSSKKPLWIRGSNKIRIHWFTFHIPLISRLAILFSLWYFSEIIWKHIPLPFPFPGSDLCQHLWRTLILRRKGMYPTFPLLPFSFFLFRPERNCKRAEMFFFFYFTHWIFIRWWILPQQSAKGIKIVCSQLSSTDRAPNHCKVEFLLQAAVISPDRALCSEQMPVKSPPVSGKSDLTSFPWR